MSAQDNLNDQQFTTVYHATEPDRARGILSDKAFRGDHADNYTFVSTAQKSRYMDVFGPVRIKMRVPTSILEDDPEEEIGTELDQLRTPSEEHFAIRADKIQPDHILGAKRVGYNGKLQGWTP